MPSCLSVCRFGPRLVAGLFGVSTAQPVMVSLDLYRSLSNPLLNQKEALRLYDRLQVGIFVIFLIICLIDYSVDDPCYLGVTVKDIVDESYTCSRRKFLGPFMFIPNPNKTEKRVVPAVCFVNTVGNEGRHDKYL